MTRALLRLLLFLAVDAFARAGGGGGFHGGGGGFHSSGGGFHSSGFSSSSGSGGDGYLLYLYIRFVVEHPLVGIPLTIFLIWAVYQFNDNRIERREISIDSTITRGMDTELDNRRREALAVIRSRDPNFDEDAFLKRASGAFLAIQQAWSDLDMTRARAFVSDGVFERFSRQIADYKDRGIRNKMTGVAVDSAEALGYLAGAHYDAVFVGVKASAIDQIVREADGAILAGSGEAEPFEEVWTFLRRPGAKTLSRPGLLEGHCPSCGAPLQIADAAQCAACKAWVNSAEHDWVLTAITQVTEWSFPSRDNHVTGWEELREADPELSLEALEDRAAVAFWRWLDARRRGDPAPLGGIASPEFVRGQQWGGGFERDAAVGLVETIAFEDGADFDRAHVQVRWEAEGVERDGGASRGRERRTHYLIFKRRAGVTSDIKAGLRTSRCPSCGAAPESPDAASCAYCSRPFNDGSASWVLSEIVPYGQWRRPVEDNEVPVARTGLDWGDELPAAQAFAVLLAGLGAHGTVDDRERAFLRAYADKRGLAADSVEGMIQSALDRRLEVPTPKSAAESETILRGLIRMGLADGRIPENERALMVAFGARQGLSEKEVGQMIKEERLALHARASAALAGR